MPPGQSTPPVFIVGIHRSGTSLLTRMIEALGVFVGNDLQDDHESLSVIAVNNHYLNQTKTSWDRPRYPGMAEMGENVVKRVFQTNEQEFFARYGSPAGHWAIKDPRLVITLPLWRGIYPESPVIIIRRNPVAIAESLYQRHQHHLKAGIFPRTEEFMKKGNIKFTQRCATFEGALSFALEQNDALNRLAGNRFCSNRIELSYEGLCHDPAFELWNIARFLQLKPDPGQVISALSMPEGRDAEKRRWQETATTLFDSSSLPAHTGNPLNTPPAPATRKPVVNPPKQPVIAKPHDFLVVGAQKAGTTSLHKYLQLHPRIILPATRKELHFFDHDNIWTNGKPAYDRYNQLLETDPRILQGMHERMQAGGHVKGEITPIYMYWKPCIERIKAYNPHIRLIAILRNPITRAISQHSMEYGRGNEKLDLWSALNCEAERLAAEPNGQHRVYSYMARGFYTRQIMHMREHFPESQLLLLTSEELEFDRVATLNKICRFLAIDEFYSGDLEEKLPKHHVGKRSENPGKQEIHFLKNVFEQEIMALSRLLDRDLSDWLAID